MIRCRLPGGVCDSKQWLQMDRISDEHGNGTFKLTTRQTFQFHGIVKGHLKPAMQAINRSMMDTIAACGDVSAYNWFRARRKILIAWLRSKCAVHGQPSAIAYSRSGVRVLEEPLRTLAT
jgi:hypothetical protein